MASSRSNDRRDMMMRMYMQMMMQQQKQKSAGQAQVLQEQRAREAQLLQEQRALSSRKSAGSTLTGLLGDQGFLDAGGYGKALEAGVSEQMASAFRKTNNQANALERVPQFSARAQEQDLLSNQPGSGKPIVPGLASSPPRPRPGEPLSSVPLSRASRELKQHPIDIQTMLKRKAEQNKQQRLLQTSQLAGRVASDVERTDTLRGQMAIEDFPNKFARGTDPRIAGRVASGAGFQPLAPKGQSMEKGLKALIAIEKGRDALKTGGIVNEQKLELYRQTDPGLAAQVEAALAMRDTATLTGLYDALEARVREKTPGLPSRPQAKKPANVPLPVKPQQPKLQNGGGNKFKQLMDVIKRNPKGGRVTGRGSTGTTFLQPPVTQKGPRYGRNPLEAKKMFPDKWAIKKALKSGEIKSNEEAEYLLKLLFGMQD